MDLYPSGGNMTSGNSDPSKQCLGGVRVAGAGQGPVSVNVDGGRGTPVESSDESVREWIDELAAGRERPYVRVLARDSTVAYEHGWADYIRFASFCGLQVAPRWLGDGAHLATIGRYAVWCLEARPRLSRPSRGGQPDVLGVGLAWSTVSVRLAGVAYHLRAAGHPDPMASPQLKAVLQALKRLHYREPKRSTALTVDRIRSMVDLIGVDVRAPRWRALAVLAHHRVPLRALQRLCWEDLDDEGPSWRFAGGPYPVDLRRADDTPELCPLTALAALRGDPPATSGPVFGALDGTGALKVDSSGRPRASSHQALAKELRRLAGDAGVPVSPGVGIPDLRNPDTARAVLERIGR